MFNKGIMNPTSLLINILIRHNKASCQMAKLNRFIKFRLTSGWGMCFLKGCGQDSAGPSLWSFIQWASLHTQHTKAKMKKETHDEEFPSIWRLRLSQTGQKMFHEEIKIQTQRKEMSQRQSMLFVECWSMKSLLSVRRFLELSIDVHACVEC